MYDIVLRAYTNTCLFIHLSCMLSKCSMFNTCLQAGLDEDSEDEDDSGDDECCYQDNQNFHTQLSGAAPSKLTSRRNDTRRSEHDSLVRVQS